MRSPVSSPSFGPLFRGAVLRRSIGVALVVGTVLNAINQGDRLAQGLSPVWTKLLLTYLVPFLVASYGAWSGMAAAHDHLHRSTEQPGGGSGDGARGAERP